MLCIIWETDKEELDSSRDNSPRDRIIVDPKELIEEAKQIATPGADRMYKRHSVVNRAPDVKRKGKIHISALV